MSAGRRRRTAPAGLMMVLAGLCAACSSATDEGSSEAAERSARASSAPTAPAPAPVVVLGPDGVGPLELGMTPEAIATSGAAETFVGARHDGWRPGCRVVVYRPEVLGQLDTVNGSVSRQHGLEELAATSLMATPEGIRLGSSIAEVIRAYGLSDVQPGEGIVVRASDTADYQIQLDPDVVTSISLELRVRRCTI